jgi:hypothetical protein
LPGCFFELLFAGSDQEGFVKHGIRYGFVLMLSMILGSNAWAQWSSDPSKNLALADNNDGADQVQPKVKPLPDHGWYVSWFDDDPNSPPPHGYSVFLQRLGPAGVEKFPHGGIEVAHLSNSSTEDYGLDIDTAGNALLAFLDTREGSNQQVTAAKIGPGGKALWGRHGVQVTTGSTHSNAAPKIAGTSDGDVVVAWISDSNTVLQKLDANGKALWGTGVVLSESGYNYELADLHAADNGSVIVSWVRNHGFGSDNQLRANKISAAGKLLWGAKNVTIFDTGSLQFGNFPYFVPDGKGGAVFAWYTNSSALQCFAQHILADGSEAYPHNGSPASTNTSDVRVDPAASYRASTDEVFLVWTEEDANQSVNGIYAQKFGPKGARRWGQTGLVIVPLGADSEILPSNVQVGDGALMFWIDMQGFGNSTIQAARLHGDGTVKCTQFPVSTAMSNKDRPVADIVTASGLAALAFEDDRIGSNGIYIQNVNRDCSLGQK